MHVTQSTVLLTVFAFLVLMVECGKSEEEKQREAWEKTFKAVGEAIGESAGSKTGSADPGFTLSAITHMDGRTVCWEITNRCDDPVTVHRVVFNGEWEAPVAGTGSWMPTGDQRRLIIPPERVIVA